MFLVKVFYLYMTIYIYCHDCGAIAALTDTAPTGSLSILLSDCLKSRFLLGARRLLQRIFFSQNFNVKQHRTDTLRKFAIFVFSLHRRNVVSEECRCPKSVTKKKLYPGDTVKSQKTSS